MFVSALRNRIFEFFFFAELWNFYKMKHSYYLVLACRCFFFPETLAFIVKHFHTIRCCSDPFELQSRPELGAKHQWIWATVSTEREVIFYYRRRLRCRVQRQEHVSEMNQSNFVISYIFNFFPSMWKEKTYVNHFLSKREWVFVTGTKCVNEHIVSAKRMCVFLTY